MINNTAIICVTNARLTMRLRLLCLLLLCDPSNFGAVADEFYSMSYCSLEATQQLIKDSEKKYFESSYDMKNFQNLLKIYLNLLTNFNLNKKLINGRNFYQTKGAFESQIFLETQKAPWSLEYSKNAETNQYFLGSLQLLKLSFTY